MGTTTSHTTYLSATNIQNDITHLITKYYQNNVSPDDPSKFYSINFTHHQEQQIDIINHNTDLVHPTSHLERLKYIFCIFPFPELRLIVWNLYCKIYLIDNTKCIICLEDHKYYRCRYIKPCQSCLQPGHIHTNCPKIFPDPSNNIFEIQFSKPFHLLDVFDTQQWFNDYTLCMNPQKCYIYSRYRNAHLMIKFDIYHCKRYINSATKNQRYFDLYSQINNPTSESDDDYDFQDDTMYINSIDTNILCVNSRLYKKCSHNNDPGPHTLIIFPEYYFDIEINKLCEMVSRLCRLDVIIEHNRYIFGDCHGDMAMYTSCNIKKTYSWYTISCILEHINTYDGYVRIKINNDGYLKIKYLIPSICEINFCISEGYC